MLEATENSNIIECFIRIWQPLCIRYDNMSLRDTGPVLS